jgi:hypothetical protein
VGDTWVYTVSRYGGDPASWSRADTIRITGLQVIGGDEYYLTNQCLAFHQTSDGLSFACYDGSAFAFEIFLRTPSDVSAKYIYFPSRAPRQFKVSVDMTTEGVVTPSGTYPTLTYRTWLLGEGPFFTLSFAPGVGLVKMVDMRGELWLLSSRQLVGGSQGGSTGKVDHLCDP